MSKSQEDYSAYFQAPVYFVLRNAASPAVASVLVQNLKDAEYIKKKQEEERNQGPSNNSPAKSKIEDITFADMLRMVHNRGKKEEEKRKKNAIKNVDDQESESASRTLHINNLKEHENELRQLKVRDFFDEANFPNLANKLGQLDVTFPLNILTSDILKFNLTKEVFSALYDVKSVRNYMYHSKGRVEIKDVDEKFKKLCSALYIIFKYLDRPDHELEAIVNQGNKLHAVEPSLFIPNILGTLREELDKRYDGMFSDVLKQSVSPTLKDTRGETKVIEDFEEFLGKDELPILLCGAPGSGKSTILQKLTQKFYAGSHKLKYELVMYLNSSSRIIDECDFRGIVSKEISACCPNSVSEYGFDTIMEVIRSNAAKVLFLVSWNIRSLKDKISSMFGGKWVVCSQLSDDEYAFQYHVIRVEPLNDILIKQMLYSYISDSAQYQFVVDLYDDCNYKGLLASPDVVALFSEIRVKTPCEELLQSYINRRLEGVQNVEDKCIALGKIAFQSILKNRGEYPAEDLCNISKEVQNAFLIPSKNNTSKFKLPIIEDLLASKYVASNLQEACKEWLNQVPLFKRVFRFTCARLCGDEALLRRNFKHLKPFLSKYIGIKPCRRTKGEMLGKSDVEMSGKAKFKVSQKANLEYDICKIEGESSAVDSFHRWNYLITLAECCKFHSRMMELLCNLLSKKSTWVFKCKFIEEEKLTALTKILKYIKLSQPVVIRIESGYAVGTLNKIWQMISELPGLYKNATVQITIRHRKSVPQSQESGLSELTKCIALVNVSLYITRYIGPFICSTPEFLKCRSMRKIAILDVCVYDVTTLVEVLSCEGLSKLKAIYIKVNLRESNRDVTGFPNFRLPNLPDSVDMKLTIIYFDGLQQLLDRVENPEQLHSLIIHGMRIKEDFHLTFSAFVKLESLFIRFCRSAACPVEDYQLMEIDEGCDQPMETEQISCQSLESDHECRMDVDPPLRSQDFSHRNWPLKLRVELDLPKSLQRVLLRNAGFCSDTNTFLLIDPWKNNTIQRLTILDSFLSIKGVRKILKDHLPISEEEQTSRLVKKLHVDSTGKMSTAKNTLIKHQRLAKEERERRRQHKPEGKELIITSQIKLCSTCQQFQCCSQSSLERHDRDTLQDVINLIEDIYDSKILSLSYTSDVVTVRKDMCGDLRVHCCLTNLDDDMIENIDNGRNEFKTENIDNGRNECLKFLNSLVLAQCICLEHTKLTLKGALCLIKVLKKIKGDCEPFSLAVRSENHLPSDDEVRNSSFVNFLKQQTCLVQFKYSCYCEKVSHYIKKSRENDIYLNDQQL